MVGMDFGKYAKSEKHENIISNAAKVFAEQGYHKTTMESIARAANVGKSTLYEYFSSKEELFASIIEHGCTYYMSRFLDFQAGHNDPKASIRNLVENWACFIRSHHHLYKVMWEYSKASLDYEMDKQMFVAMNEMMVKPLKQALCQGIDMGIFREMNAEINSWVMVNMLMGLSNMFIIDNWHKDWQGIKDEEEIYQQLINTVEDILLKGISK